MKAILISERISGYTADFNKKLNLALEQIENEDGFIREKIYTSYPSGEHYIWQSVLIYYEIIPTRKVITEKHK